MNTQGVTFASWEMGVHKQILSLPIPHEDIFEVHSIQVFRGFVAGLAPDAHRGDRLNNAPLTSLSSLYGCFEKSQWDVLTPQQQSTYCVYTIGNNVIENLNASYKSDMWNTLIGESRGNFLSIVTNSPIYAPRRDSAEPRPRGCSGLGEPRPALPSF